MLDENDVRQRYLDFEARFGRGGAIDLYFAPGRVNLIGEHTDYNGGLVLPMAIEQGTYLMIRRSELPPCRLYTENLEREARILPDAIEKTEDWADYVRGVYSFSMKECEGIAPFDAMYFGDLPMGAGLSSSASIEVVTALGMETLGCHLSSDQIVKVSRRAENEFVGVACGIMDQFAVAFASQRHALLLDCETLDYRHIPYNLMNTVLVIAHTGVRRSLTDSEYNTRRMECRQALDHLSKKTGEKTSLSQVSVSEFERARWSMPEKLAARAEHVIYENVRVEEVARSLENGDAETMGRLMNRSHQSLRDLFDVSSHELDALQEISVNQLGVYGCRMTGAGFGGCVIALMKAEAVERYMRRVPSLYWKSTHYETDMTVVAPGEGAHRM